MTFRTGIARASAAQGQNHSSFGTQGRQTIQADLGLIATAQLLGFYLVDKQPVYAGEHIWGNFLVHGGRVPCNAQSMFFCTGEQLG